MGSLSVAGSGTGQQNNVIDVSKLKRGGVSAGRAV
jgi:hypothetical protein